MAKMQKQLYYFQAEEAKQKVMAVQKSLDDAARPQVVHNCIDGIYGTAVIQPI